MRKRKPEAEKKKPGPKPHRTFYNQIGFQVAKPLHAVMSDITKEKNLRLEDVYAEAIHNFLEMRKNGKIIYMPSPIRRFAKRIAIHMEPCLEELVRFTSQEDQQRLVDFFQTAVWLYLKQLNRLPS